MVKKWLEVIKLSEYYCIFIENGFDDLDRILGINTQDLNQINILKLGHQKSIIKAAELLNNIPPSAASASSAASKQSAASAQSAPAAPSEAYSPNLNGRSLWCWYCRNCNWKNLETVDLCGRCGVKNKKIGVDVEGMHVVDTANLI